MSTFGRPLAPLALALMLLPFAGRMRRNGRRLGGMLTVLLLLCGAAATMALSGCNKQNGYFSQAPQSYPVTVTATTSLGGGSVLQHSAAVTLNVQ
jgi:lipopolysaccharide export LptBFGC system permease protein LptF